VKLADKPIADITTADVEQVRVNWPLKTKAPKGGITGPDRALERLRHVFNWSIRMGIVDSSPFRKAHLNVITFDTGKREQKKANRRSRRRPPTLAPTSGGASYTIS
jgi:hypothetical protein